MHTIIKIKDEWSDKHECRLWMQHRRHPLLCGFGEKKVRRFTVDCLKVFADNITAHGNLEWTRFTIPYECSLKYLNRKYIFTKKKDASEWLENKMENREKICN